MRLDEWQKYIDSQFLDDAPAPPAPAAGQPEAAHAPLASKDAAQPLLLLENLSGSAESALIAPASTLDANVAPSSAAPLPAGAEPQNKQHSSGVAAPFAPPLDAPPAAPVPANAANGELPEPALSITHSVFTLVVSPPAPTPAPSGRPPRIEILTPLNDAPAALDDAPATVLNKTRRRSQSRAAQPAMSTVAAGSQPDPDPAVPAIVAPELFLPLSDLGEDIPEFARYLPASHAAAPEAVADAPGTPQPRHADSTASDMTLGSSAARRMPGDDEGTGAFFAPETTGEPTPQYINALSASITPGQHSDEAAGGLCPVRKAIRRAPRSRTRPTHALPPANTPSAAPGGEMRAGGPRYMQTLLALERIEEEDEVAQSSYKRPFQEKRHELIERLLDPILSLEDTARLLNVCPTTVRRYTNKGILTYYRKEVRRGGKTIESDTDADANGEKETRQRRFRLSDVLAFLESQQSAPDTARHALRRQRARAMQSQEAGLQGSQLDPGENFHAAVRACDVIHTNIIHTDIIHTEETARAASDA